MITKLKLISRTNSMAIPVITRSGNKMRQKNSLCCSGSRQSHKEYKSLKSTTSFIKINPITLILFHFSCFFKGSKKNSLTTNYYGPATATYSRGHLQGGCFQSKSKTTLCDFVSIVLTFKDIYCNNKRIYKINILMLVNIRFF